MKSNPFSFFTAQKVYLLKHNFTSRASDISFCGLMKHSGLKWHFILHTWPGPSNAISYFFLNFQLWKWKFVRKFSVVVYHRLIRKKRRHLHQTLIHTFSTIGILWNIHQVRFTYWDVSNQACLKKSLLHYLVLVNWEGRCTAARVNKVAKRFYCLCVNSWLSIVWISSS